MPEPQYQLVSLLFFSQESTPPRTVLTPGLLLLNSEQVYAPYSNDVKPLWGVFLSFQCTRPGGWQD